MKVPTNVHSVMIIKYPKANFSNYFSFLEQCRPTSKRLHKHHIAPKSLFPSLDKDKENLIKLTVPQHQKAHALLAKQLPSTSWPSPKFIEGSGTTYKAPGWYAALSAGIRRRNRDPKRLREWQEAIRKRSQSPQWKTKNAAALAKLAKSSKRHAAVVIENIRRSKDPKYIAKHAVALSKMHKDPKWQAAVAAANTKKSKDPKWIAAHATAMRKLSKSLKWIAAHAAAMKLRRRKQ